MKKKAAGILFLSLSLSLLKVTAQSHEVIDSLKNALGKETDPKIQTDILIALSEQQTFSNIDEKITYLESAERICMQNNLPVKLAHAWVARGILHAKTNSYKKALKYSFKADSIYDAKGMNDLRDGTFNVIAGCYYNMGRLDSSELFFQKSLKIRLVKNDTLGIMSSFVNIGSLKRRKGQYDSSSYYLHKALTLSEALNNERYLLISYYNLILTNKELANNELMFEYANKLFDLSTATNNKIFIRVANQTLGDCERTNGNYSKAREYYQRTFEAANSAGDKEMLVIVLNRLASVSQREGKNQEAQNHLQEAVGILSEMEDPFRLSQTLISLAEINLSLNLTKEAQRNLAKSHELLLKTNQETLSVEYYKIKIKYFGRTGNYDSLSHYFQSYEELQESIQQKSTSKEVSKWQVKYETEQKEQEISRLQSAAAIQALEIRQRNTFMIVSVLGIILAVIISILYSRQSKLKALQKETDVEQKLLRTQMNPHFIFNALVSIEKFIYESNIKEAGKYLSNFAKLMRRTLENSRMKSISLSEEIATLEEYLTLQKLRFGENIDYEIKVDPGIDIHETRLPPMFAQPLIENAIEHGITHKNDKGLLKISFLQEEGYLKLVVEDNGVGKEMALSLKEKSYKSLSGTIAEERIAIMNKRNKRKITFSLEDVLDGKQVAGTRAVFSFPV